MLLLLCFNVFVCLFFNMADVFASSANTNMHFCNDLNAGAGIITKIIKCF